MKRLGALFLSIALAPTLLGAEARPAICSIDHTVKKGNSGGDVTILQQFLADQGYFHVVPTGYFGFITEASLANWQLDVGIITRISEGGVFGPRTRAYVREHFCGGVAQQSQNLCPTVPAPPTQPACTGTWQKTYDAKQCHVGWTCVVIAPPQTVNKPPRISSIIGPSKLNANESGTWNITATDPENDALSFSVVWGDEGANLSRLLALAGGGTFTTRPSFTHAYAKSGTYTMIVFAKDTASNDATATFSIAVESPPPPVTNTTDTTNTNGGVPCMYNGRAYAEGGTYTAYVACPYQTAQVQPCQATYTCHGGQWVIGTQTVGASCTRNGQTYPHGQTAFFVPPCPLGCWTGNEPVCASQMACSGLPQSFICSNGQWVSWPGAQTGGSCSYNGRTYLHGETCYFEGCPGENGWNSGHMTVCRSGQWQWLQCGWPNMTGPGRFPYCS